MALVFKNYKNGKKSVTSSYFSDIAEIRRSKSETDYQGLKKDKVDLSELKVAFAVMELTLWKKGCRELSEYVEKLNPKQLEGLTVKYMGQTVDENDISLAKVMTEEEFLEYSEKKLPSQTR